MNVRRVNVREQCLCLFVFVRWGGGCGVGVHEQAVFVNVRERVRSLENYVNYQPWFVPYCTSVLEYSYCTL